MDRRTSPILENPSSTNRPAVCVIVLAHNEEARIGKCLQSLPPVSPDLAIHVVVNGSSDGTATIARRFSGVTVHEYAQGGKARSWNRIMLDTPGIEGDAFVFVDGDAVVLPGSIPLLASTVDQPGINAASGLPANGRHFEAYRDSMIANHGLFGDLYALSGDFVARLRASGLRMPEDLIGDDSLIGALAKTDLQEEFYWQDSRVVPVEGAGFLCQPFAPSFAGARSQARRMVNYSLRHFQNRIVTSIMRTTGPSGLPHRMASLYDAYLPRLKPRLDPRCWWFDHEALGLMRRAAAALPMSPAPGEARKAA